MNNQLNESQIDLTLDSTASDNIITQPSVISTSNEPNNDSLTIASPDRNNVVVVSSERGYTLNIDKVLRKKIAACRQVMAEYEVTGGGITGRMDTATFELFRAACSKLYREFPPEEGFCKIVDSDDKKGKAVVQHTFRVYRVIDENRIGYTINLYPTNNRMLINGKDVDRFMDEHLPLLHGLMIEALSEFGFRGVEAMNNMLGEQMSVVAGRRRGEACSAIVTSENSNQSDSIIPEPASASCNNDNSEPISESGGASRTLTRTRSSSRMKQSQTQAKCNNSSKRRSESYKPKTEDQCPVCNRNIKSKAAHCETGNHWVHYHCDKLTDVEIHRLENDKGVIYNCKSCLSQNTCPKTVIDSQVNNKNRCVSQNKATLQIPSISNSNDLDTPAIAILIEETGQMCGVCDKNIDTKEVTCDTCKSSCHVTCMVDSDPEKCISCGAYEMQDQHSSTPEPQVEKRTSSQSTLQPHIDLSTSNEVEIVQSKSASTSVKDASVNQETTAPNRSNQSKPSKKDIDGNGNKQRELRQWDLKLRKWEEELKLREAKSNDMTKDFSRLEDYVRKTEARNVELEKTVRTLQRKINLLEHEQSRGDSRVGEINATETVNVDRAYTLPRNEAMRTSTCCQSSSSVLESDRLISGVREQVTQFILSKVKSEIDKLERNTQQYPEFQPRPSVVGLSQASAVNAPNGPYLHTQSQSPPQVYNLYPSQSATVITEGQHGVGAKSDGQPDQVCIGSPNECTARAPHPGLQHKPNNTSAEQVPPAGLFHSIATPVPNIQRLTNKERDITQRQVPFTVPDNRLKPSASRTVPMDPHPPIMMRPQCLPWQSGTTNGDSMNGPHVGAMYTGQPLIVRNTSQLPRTTVPFLSQAQPLRVIR